MNDDYIYYDVDDGDELLNVAELFSRPGCQSTMFGDRLAVPSVKLSISSQSFSVSGPTVSVVSGPTGST